MSPVKKLPSLTRVLSFAVVGSVDVARNHAQVHAQAQCVGKAFPLVEVLVEQQVVGLHEVLGVEGCLGVVHFLEYTGVNVLAVVVVGLADFGAFEGFAVRRLARGVNEHLERVGAEHRGCEKVGRVGCLALNLLDVLQRVSVSHGVAAVDELAARLYVVPGDVVVLVSNWSLLEVLCQESCNVVQPVASDCSHTVLNRRHDKVCRYVAAAGVVGAFVDV